MDRQFVSSHRLPAGLVALFLLLTTSAGCTRHIGKTIDVPEIPVTASQGHASSHSGTVTVTLFKDVRRNDATTETEASNHTTTQPQGAVGETVADALATALTARGINVTEGSPVRIWGEVRRWESSVTTTTTGVIRSAAAVYVEVLGSDGRPVYSGTYHGSRTSQFPFVSARDVQDSLAIAMAQAIEQAVNDEELLRAIW